MRPRVFPAENTHSRYFGALIVARFNEAAGIPRGKHASHTFSSLEDSLQ